MPHIVSTKDLFGLRAVSAKNGKKIGKVRRFVFHPSEKRLIGVLVKRPDAALMFHRKDLFAAIGGFSLSEGELVVSDAPAATDRGAIKALGVNWEKCVLWLGMPVMTAAGDLLGYVGSVSFDLETGAVKSIVTENGAANDAILGKRTIPANLVQGFRIGEGAALVPAGEYQGEDEEDENAVRGAILVSDKALELSAEGGAAAAAGKATAVATVKVKRGAVRAKEGAAKAKVAVDEQVEKAKPAAQRAAKIAGEAAEAGTFAVGRQLGRASGMFSAFKEEFDKALHEDDEA